MIMLAFIYNFKKVYFFKQTRTKCDLVHMNFILNFTYSRIDSASLADKSEPVSK